MDLQPRSEPEVMIVSLANVQFASYVFLVGLPVALILISINTGIRAHSFRMPLDL
jgi:hypothetical protein